MTALALFSSPYILWAADVPYPEARIRRAPHIIKCSKKIHLGKGTQNQEAGKTQREKSSLA